MQPYFLMFRAPIQLATRPLTARIEIDVYDMLRVFLSLLWRANI